MQLTLATHLYPLLKEIILSQCLFPLVDDAVNAVDAVNTANRSKRRSRFNKFMPPGGSATSR